jgi:hypothetical protein
MEIEKEWTTQNGLQARVIMAPMGHRCGYVGLDANSGLYEIQYDSIENRIEVHGGLTFSDTFVDSDLWWLGYDCAHSCDQTRFNPKGMKRTLQFCIDECEFLAKQIYQTPLDYLFRAKKYGKIPEVMHNQMLSWALTKPNDEIIKEYFEILKN